MQWGIQQPFSCEGNQHEDARPRLYPKASLHTMQRNTQHTACCSYVCRRVFVDVYNRVFVDVYKRVFVDMCIDMLIDLCKDMSIDVL